MEFSMRNKITSAWWSSTCTPLYMVPLKDDPMLIHCTYYPKKCCSFPKPQHQAVPGGLGGLLSFLPATPAHSPRLSVLCVTPLRLGTEGALPREIWCIVIPGLRPRSSSKNPKPHCSHAKGAQGSRGSLPQGRCSWAAAVPVAAKLCCAVWWGDLGTASKAAAAMSHDTSYS